MFNKLIVLIVSVFFLFYSPKTRQINTNLEKTMSLFITVVYSRMSTFVGLFYSICNNLKYMPFLALSRACFSPHSERASKTFHAKSANKCFSLLCVLMYVYWGQLYRWKYLEVMIVALNDWMMYWIRAATMAKKYTKINNVHRH